MRCLQKINIPTVLSENHSEWLKAYLEDMTNSNKKFRYRHSEIKSALKSETGDKCIYCESKIGHNTPGDVEHILPSSKFPQLHFTWSNLSIACTECNRRKNDYYEENEAFLNPYLDDVESMVEHYGPLVVWKSNDTRAEISVTTLALNSEKRLSLILHKIESIDRFNHLIERYLTQNDQTLKELLWLKIQEAVSFRSEYSGMLLAILVQKSIQSPA